MKNVEKEKDAIKNALTIVNASNTVLFEMIMELRRELTEEINVLRDEVNDLKRKAKEAESE